ncbi:TetR/AcrR family transcriptional regulator [Tepidibacter formicigenes]|uniref:Transcriptional regulator, TetR family n=1 Tax=Tepidibacter formicigenes DSM 15518 TaxID=1123349 RepID=A0A1M6S115_9FIRM|nr:TetR/AcrR family transcriptional regulator [Tepidibacter formicigenes]SHK38228.1 transcriptional regulator, TetR family [Tepidibacter formicigenes DSM 15518]
MSSKKSKQTKDKIFNAALKVFSEKGFSGATTSEISKEAGVAEGTIFRYYKTKKDILRGVMLEYVERFDDFVNLESLKKIIKENKDKSIEEILKIILLDRYKVFEKHYDIMKVIHYEMQFHEDIKNMHCEKIKEKEYHMSNYIFEQIKINKEEYKNIDYKVISRIFRGMMFGVFFQRKIEKEKDNIISIEKEIDIMIDIFFNGIKKN